MVALDLTPRQRLIVETAARLIAGKTYMGKSQVGPAVQIAIALIDAAAAQGPDAVVLASSVVGEIRDALTPALIALMKLEHFEQLEGMGDGETANENAGHLAMIRTCLNHVLTFADRIAAGEPPRRRST